MLFCGLYPSIVFIRGNNSITYDSIQGKIDKWKAGNENSSSFDLIGNISNNGIRSIFMCITAVILELNVI